MRARYLFFWKNCYGVDTDQIHTDEESYKYVLIRFSTQPDDDRNRAVGAVPDAKFEWLDEAGFDEEPEPLTNEYVMY